MSSVTRDKKKYGAPTVYDKHKKKKVDDEIRQADFEANRDKERQDGKDEPLPGSGGSMKKPVRYE